MADGIDRNLLERDRINSHWAEISTSLSRLLTWMDSRENWVAEPEAELLELLNAVIARIDEQRFVREVEQGEGAAALSEVFATLHSSRFVRVLEMMDRRAPGIASRLTLAMGRLGGVPEAYANLFFERLMVMHKCELLGQIFSRDRSAKIAASVQMIQESRR